MDTAVPVIMYHSVGPYNANWIWRHLITPVSLFEDQIRALSRELFSTITLKEHYGYLKYNKHIPSKSIILTFDDGYLDNWVYVFPILKKYNMKGTIFVNPEFVDPTEKYRPNIEDVWNGRYKEDDLVTRGFLSWREMRFMEESGVMDIQSHAMSHTWFYCSEEIIDFHHPGNNKYPWLFWNARPERKSQYLDEDQETFIPYGTPIYQHGRALGVRRYLEDSRLSDHVVRFVAKQEDNFFLEKDWRKILFEQVEHYKVTNRLYGRYETDSEQIERYRYELTESKKILEDKLNKEINFLCWAGGAYNNTALTIAQEAGYLSTTLFYNEKNRRNVFGETPSEINRIGCVSDFTWRNKFRSYTDPGYFMANIKYFLGEKKYLLILRLYKLKYLMRYYIGSISKRGDQ